MLVNQTPIPNLQTIKCWSDVEEDFEYAIVDAIASNYQTIVNFDLVNCYASSSDLLKIVECCTGIERLLFFSKEPSDLKRSDIEGFHVSDMLLQLESC
jgi:hypothetical protein